MRIIKGLLDRIIFATGVLLFMQIPHFIDQYEQRLGGYYQAQVKHLDRYQHIAKQQHQGNMLALIKEFESSSKSSVRQTGKNIRDISEEVSLLKKDVDVLAQHSFIEKLSHLMVSVRLDIANAVMRTYTPAFPFSIEGLLCGFVGGIVLSMLFNMFLTLPKILFRESKQPKQPSRANPEQRVEPTIMRTPKAA